MQLGSVSDCQLGHMRAQLAPVDRADHWLFGVDLEILMLGADSLGREAFLDQFLWQRPD